MKVGTPLFGSNTTKDRSLETRLTKKGQVTIPQAIRARLGLKPKDRVRFEVDGETVTITPAPSRIAKHFGSVTVPSELRDLSDRELRETFEKAVAEEVSREGV